MDERSEAVIDHIVRKLLLHQPSLDETPNINPKVKKFDYSWTDQSFLKKLYDDKTFPKMVELMYAAVITSCFKTTTSISQKITLTKVRGVDIDYDLMSWSQYKYLLDNIKSNNKQSMEFRDKEMFVWSFCVIIATKIVNHPEICRFCHILKSIINLHIYCIHML